MDRLPDPWKRCPLLVLGAPPVPLPDAHACVDAGARLAPEAGEFFVLVACPPEETSAAIDSLLEKEIRPEQLLVHWRGENVFSHPRLPLLGCLEEIPGESPEDFRLRLLARAEIQRQKQLASALGAGMGQLAGLPPEERRARIDSARIAHALACCYGLSPGAHARALEACLRASGPQASIWSAETAPERVVAEVAQFALACLNSGRSLREALRERSSSLPFHARTELTQHVESCLGSILGGRHAA